jgi:malonyl-CoA/methylmalonyl-CoA synthetase
LTRPRHLRPETDLPDELEELRARLRRGSLAEALFPGGSGPALREGEVELSHDQLRREADSVAAGLAAHGLRPGDRISIFAAGSLQWALAYLGAVRAGLVVNPFNPAYRRGEVEHILSDADPKLVLVDRERLPLVRDLRPSLPLDDVPRGEGWAGPPPLGPESPAMILYTSGTTGKPKGALIDHGNFLAQARGVIEAWRWQPADRLVLALPLFHLHGLGIGLHGTLIAGASAELMPFSPEGVVAALQSGATMFFGVPAMYQRLTQHLEDHPADLSRVRLFVSGSAPLAPALFERCRRLLGQPVLERYGITEGGIAVSNPYDGPRQPGRVGWPLPGVEVRLGEQDEVQLKGGQVFHGYWRNEAATREVFVDGWLRTGDVGEVDAEGSLAIRGRLKELIITGGFNVYPREVEVALEAHPAVAEVAVAGIPSERWGEEVTAFVVPARAVPEQELIAFARQRLATYKCPRQVRFVDALPRNAMGKVEKGRLTIERSRPEA